MNYLRVTYPRSRKAVLSIIFCVMAMSLTAQTANFDSLNRSWKNHHLSDSLRIDALEGLIYQTVVHTSVDSALDLVKSMFHFADSSKNLMIEAKAWFWLGWANQYKGLEGSDTIIPCYRRSLQLMKQIGDSFQIAKAFETMGTHYLNRTNLDSSLKYHEKALEVYEAIKHEPGIAEIYKRFGIAGYIKGDYRTALKNFYKSRKINEGIGDNKDAGYVLMYIAKTYWRLGHLDRAKENGQKALAFHRKDSLSTEALLVKDFLAVIEFEKGNHQEGIEGLTQVIEAAKMAGEEHAMANALLNRAEFYKILKNYEVAVQDLLHVVKIRERTVTSSQALQITLATLAETYAEMGKFDDAIKVSNRILNLQKENSSGDLVIESSSAYHSLYLAYKAKGKVKLALEMLEKYMSLQEKLKSEEANRELAFQQYAYQTEIDSLKFDVERAQLSATQSKLESENLSYEKRQNLFLLLGGLLSVVVIFGFILYRANLKRKEAQQKEQQSLLRQQVQENKMKAIRAQFKPHFISNLQMAIQNFIDKENIRMAKKYLDLYSGLMRGILENSDRALVSVSEELDILEKYLELHKPLLVHPLEYKFIVSQAVDRNNDRMPPNILQPLAENAIQHGISPLDRAGLVTIQIEKVNGYMNFSVEDNGVGRPSHGNGQATSGNGSSFGTRLVKDQLEVIEKQTGKPCPINSVDLKKPDGTPAGTRIEFKIPSDL